MSFDSVTSGPSPWRLPMVRVLGAWCMGIVAGQAVGGVWAWVGVSIALLLGVGLLRVWRRWHNAVTAPLLLLCIACSGAAWYTLRSDWRPASDLARQVTPASRLVDLEGVVEGPVHHRIAPRGQLARYAYAPPSTSFVLRVDRWYGDGGHAVVHGKLLVHLPAFDDRPQPGDRVRAQGWLRPSGSASNLGEFDFAASLRRQGICGRLHLKTRGNWQWVESAATAPFSFAAWQRQVSGRARQALHDAMDGQVSDPGLALLDALLLGERSADLGDLADAFRKTGLAHLLSISGLHVGILAAGVWFAVRLITGRPRWPAVAAMGGVAVYLVIVPWRVPLIRAAIMTGVFCWAIASGRRISSLSAMAAAGVVLLIWRPDDLLAPGFQLSFGVVTGLLLFTRPVARWMRRESFVDTAAQPNTSGVVRRWLSEYLAVSLVAFAVALPLVAYHFGLISPLAVVLSPLMLPIVATLLWLGFAVVVLGLAWPGAAGLIAPLLGWLTDGCVAAVRGGAQIPAGWVTVPAPSPAWGVAAMLVVGGLFAGWFARRRSALAVCGVVCGVWLMWPAVRTHTAWLGGPALRVDMIALGDGSCYVLRSGGEVAMFDCGTSSYTNAGRRTITPALRAMGVRRIDRLFISHADLDHFSETLDVMDALPVGVVHVTHQLLAEAAAAPWSATGRLIERLRLRQARIQPLERGWACRFGDAVIEALWPPAQRTFERNNDSSLMLSIRAAGRRVLMCGDAADEAIGTLLAEGADLRTDVLELPHHGSFIELSPRFLAVTQPGIALQSTGERRMRYDHWPPHLGDAQRYATARDGMIRVIIEPDGRLHVKKMRPGPANRVE